MKNEFESNYESVSGSLAVEKIRALTKSARFCLFGTDLSHPPVTVRPMTVESVDDSGNLWFLSSRTSHINQQVTVDSQVQLFFTNPGTAEFLTLEGTATISDDPELRKTHWTPIAKTWFPEGVDDPNLTVIKVNPREGYYWDTKHGKTLSTLKIMIGAVTGKTLTAGVEGPVHL